MNLLWVFSPSLVKAKKGKQEVLLMTTVTVIYPSEALKSVNRNVIREQVHALALLAETPSSCSSKENQWPIPSCKHSAGT